MRKPAPILYVPILGLVTLLAAPLPAAAQMGNAPRPPDAPGPTVPPPAIPGPRTGETLSDQLQRNDGVIPPAQNVDPEMHQAPPDTGSGTMPVIPPPSGDGSVTPK